MKIIVFDESGAKLLDKTIDENDLEFNKLDKIEHEFNLKKDSKAYIHIYFYGNHLGAKADIKLSQFIIKSE